MILSCLKLCASYGTKQVLKNASLEVRPGDFICVCGANGSGKSTFLKLLSGLERGKSKKSPSFLQIDSAEKMPSLTEDDGSRTVFLLDLPRREIARRIAFLPQSEFPAWDTTVFDMILTGRFAPSGTSYTAEDYSRVKEAARFLEITPLLERSVFTLSGGEFQKCRIARAVAQQGEFLILDEPCAGLDINAESALLQKMRVLSDSGKTGVVVSIHNINAATRFAKKIALLSDGGIVCGSAEEIITPKNIARAFGEGLSVFTHPLWNCPQIG